MVTLTDLDIISLIRKNNLNADTLQEDVERITRVSGSSSVFECGVCSYANSIKQKVLGVQETTLSVLGAVSAETAVQMAEGVKKISGADIGISTTGIAGPTGGTPEKPVGLVFLGVCTNSQSYALRLELGGKENMKNSRDYIRKVTTDAALFTILDVILSKK